MSNTMFSMGMCSNRTSLLHSILYLTQTNIFQIKIETKQTNKRKHKKTCSFLCLVCPGYKFCVSDLKMKINPLKKKKEQKIISPSPFKTPSVSHTDLKDFKGRTLPDYLLM